MLKSNMLQGAEGDTGGKLRAMQQVVAADPSFRVANA